nr:hypothetical protein [uncultured Acetobacterium sp.]
MTMLASWICHDTHGPTSAYIVADSRFSTSSSVNFDFGKKVFASKSFPELFGYAGDVLFPSVVLSQIVEMIDSGILLNEKMRCEEKNSIIFERICNSLLKYQDILGNGVVQIMHITRDTCFEKYPMFYEYILTWTKSSAFSWENVKLPAESGVLGVLEVLGSGRREFHENYNRYQGGINKSTSRNVFHCFMDTLENIKDPFCGGAPQLVGLYRKPFTGGMSYGILYKGKRYFLGMEIPKGSSFDKVEWRNELFEICDGDTRKIADGAMKQADCLRHIY